MVIVFEEKDRTIIESKGMTIIEFKRSLYKLAQKVNNACTVVLKAIIEPIIKVWEVVVKNLLEVFDNAKLLCAEIMERNKEMVSKSLWTTDHSL